MSWQVFVCANIPSPDLSAPSLNSAAEIQLQKSLLHLGGKDAGERSRFLVSQMMTGFSRAQVSPGVRRMGQGAPLTAVMGSDGRGSSLRAASTSTFSVFCWNKTLVMLHREDGELLMSEENMAVPLFC